ncbi:hypothetical protein JYP51_11435 [Ponticoccus gilvus]|nr:hypothetical protein [Enemella evansiae]
MIRALAVIAGLGICPCHAQEEAREPLPDFATCMDMEAARYERALKRLREMPDAQEFEIGDERGTGYCGSVGIVLCDRLEVPEQVQDCQLALAAEQLALAAKVRDALPDPETVQTGGAFERALYPQVYALAEGISAGPDCDGAEAAFQAWCAAWEANNRLSTAVLAWQLARFMGLAEPATAAGWADRPPPVRPRAREEDS